MKRDFPNLRRSCHEIAALKSQPSGNFTGTTMDDVKISWTPMDGREAVQPNVTAGMECTPMKRDGKNA
jgi:hypothetical protein